MHVCVQFSRQHLLKRPPLPPLYVLVPFVILPTWAGLISGLCSVPLISVSVLPQYRTALITVALECTSVSRNIMLPTLFSLLKIMVAICGLSRLHVHSWFACSSSVKPAVGSLMGAALGLQTASGAMGSFPTLVFPTHEHSRCFNLFVSFSFLFFPSGCFCIFATGCQQFDLMCCGVNFFAFVLLMIP